MFFYARVHFHGKMWLTYQTYCPLQNVDKQSVRYMAWDYVVWTPYDSHCPSHLNSNVDNDDDDQKNYM